MSDPQTGQQPFTGQAAIEDVGSAIPAQRRASRRSPNGERRTKQVRVTLTDDEHDVLANAADRAGLNVTAYVAEVSLATAQGTPAPDPGTVELRHDLQMLWRQLAKVGNLLNQAVRVLHATKRPDPRLIASAEYCTRLMRRIERWSDQVGRPAA